MTHFYKDQNPSANAIVRAGNTIQLHALSLPANEVQAERTALHISAIGLYERAIESDPSNAFAFAGLELSQFEMKGLNDARSSLATADELGEWDARLAINRGQVEKALGSAENARKFWEEVAQLRSRDEASQAVALLETLDSDK